MSSQLIFKKVMKQLEQESFCSHCSATKPITATTSHIVAVITAKEIITSTSPIGMERHAYSLWKEACVKEEEYLIELIKQKGYCTVVPRLTYRSLEDNAIKLEQRPGKVQGFFLSCDRLNDLMADSLAGHKVFLNGDDEADKGFIGSVGPYELYSDFVRPDDMQHTNTVIGFKENSISIERTKARFSHNAAKGIFNLTYTISLCVADYSTLFITV